MDLIEAAAPKGRAEPPKQLTRVSERFYRADNPGKIFGTELGMSHVKEIIERHGGEMTRESQLDAGSTATLLDSSRLNRPCPMAFRSCKMNPCIT